ncbi:MAG: hypothetical protein JRJ45_00530 [Deltaproteobacteria bacterium]|nr:hypothetical protein [Deltaproteobacteria bacterium]
MEGELGIDVDLSESISIRILRAGGGNKKFGRSYTRITAPFQRRMQAKQMDDATSDRLHYEIYAESVVIGWKGIRFEGSDEDAPLTKENVVKLFVEMPDVFDIIRDAAMNMASFRKEELTAMVDPLGNS